MYRLQYVKKSHTTISAYLYCDYNKVTNCVSIRLDKNLKVWLFFKASLETLNKHNVIRLELNILHKTEWNLEHIISEKHNVILPTFSTHHLLHVKVNVRTLYTALLHEIITPEVLRYGTHRKGSDGFTQTFIREQYEPRLCIPSWSTTLNIQKYARVHYYVTIMYSKTTIRICRQVQEGVPALVFVTQNF